jgi:hypothetical protein
LSQNATLNGDVDLVVLDAQISRIEHYEPPVTKPLKGKLSLIDGAATDSEGGDFSMEDGDDEECGEEEEMVEMSAGNF